MTSTNKNLREKIAVLESDGLSDDGRFFLQHATGFAGNELLDIDTTKDKHGNTDDLTTPQVRLRSKLSRSERMRKFGVVGLQKCDWSGNIGIDGAPIPTEKYISDMVIGYGDDGEKRVYVLKIERGEKMSTAINRAGREIREMVENGDFEIANG